MSSVAKEVETWKQHWSDSTHRFDFSAVRSLSQAGLPGSLNGTAVDRYVRSAPGGVEVEIFQNAADESYLVQLVADGGQFIGVGVFNKAGAQLADGKIIEDQLEGF